MNEPRRLLDEEGTPFERSLLAAVRKETPSAELERRMRQGLAAVGVAATVKVASAGWIKVAVAGVVAAGLGTGVAVWQHRTATPLPVVAAAAPVALAPKPELKPLAPEPVEVAAEPAPAARARPVPSGASDLREEIRLLDRARAAVRDGAHEPALGLLEKYDRRFPRGQFRQEAQVLRVEALGQSGNKKAALVLGKKFLAEHPESPHVERVESVTGAPR